MFRPIALCAIALVGCGSPIPELTPERAARFHALAPDCKPVTDAPNDSHCTGPNAEVTIRLSGSGKLHDVTLSILAATPDEALLPIATALGDTVESVVIDAIRAHFDDPASMLHVGGIELEVKRRPGPDAKHTWFETNVRWIWRR